MSVDLSDRASGTRPATRARPRAASKLHQLLEHTAAGADVPEDLKAVVELDAGPDLVWTTILADGRMALQPGPAHKPTVRIITDPRTLTAVSDGSVSGVDAFLTGKLRTRGNLALALRLSSILHPEGRPDEFPRWGRITAGAVTTTYLEAGRGFPVILLHGLGATNASFLPTLSALASDYRVIAPDLPGFGDSSKPFRTYNAQFFGRWLIEFMDALGLDRVHLIGN
ncbi:MAG TPA: alpha/beta fold hydrolase, partial [Actinomycetota bacterium]|nr:alpha/beta fold hydrolase [Actinomycetota bacterium]